MISLSMLITLLCVIYLVINGANGLGNGLGLTPPMGWNSWNRFNCNIDENLIKDTADAMVKYGLDKVGYKYVNMDDCWQGDRDKDGYLTSNPTTFPGGIKAIADHVHSLGLLSGIYSDGGTLTCENKPGSLGHEKEDAMTFASWGIDYLKYDNCFDSGVPLQQRYEAMRDALNATGKPIYYSLCEWGVDDPATWGKTVGNSWRTTVDIFHSWDSVLFTLGKQRGITQHGGPGGWNDPDILEVGNGDLTVDEQKSHFSLWAALKAPLLLGFDIRNPPSDTLDIVKNQEIIAINQDPLGRSVDFVDSNFFDNWEAWAGELSDGYVALLLNRGESPATLTFNFSRLKLQGKYKVRDLWEHQDKGVFENSYSSQVARHGIAVLKLTPASST